MTLLNASLLGLNVFRQFYQFGDHSQKFSGAHRNQFDTDNKLHITCSDYISTVGVPLFEKLFPLHPVISLGLKSLEGGFRCIEIGRGLYLLRSNIEGLDRNVYRLQIVTNILNIARLALQCLQPMHIVTTYATLSICALDVILRTAFVCQRFGIDRTMRAILGGATCFLRIVSGITIIKTVHAVQHSLISVASLTLLTSLTIVVKIVVKIAMRCIFDSLRYPRIRTRNLIEWTFTILAAIPLSTVSMVKLGLSKSIVDNALGSVALLFGTIVALSGMITAVKCLDAGHIPSWEVLHKSAKITMASICLSRF